MGDGYDIFGDTRGYQIVQGRTKGPEFPGDTHRDHHRDHQHEEEAAKEKPSFNALAPSRLMQEMAESRVTRRRNHRLLRRSLTRRGWKRLSD
jgi:hypothetical protein